MERSISRGCDRRGDIANAIYTGGLRARHGGAAAVNTINSTPCHAKKAARSALEKREHEAAASQSHREATITELAKEKADLDAASVARAEAERKLEICQIAGRDKRQWGRERGERSDQMKPHTITKGIRIRYRLDVRSMMRIMMCRCHLAWGAPQTR